ncbi:MAG TPA: class I SAM-dependent methyltransferase [Syntrophales bacterium]|nr:class I SAM-dependent methyltransferase [Syntrophales bacterium]
MNRNGTCLQRDIGDGSIGNGRIMPEPVHGARWKVAIDQAFNESVEYYDSWIRKAVPGYGDLFAAACEIIPFTSDEAIDVLDLGAGTGLFASQLLKRYPCGRFVLWDVAARMLDVARQRFQDNPGQFRYVVDDYRNLGNSGSYDLVVSSLSIHHLEDGEKRELFRSIHQILRDRGLFVNIDLVRGPTPVLEEFYCKNWLEKMRRAGASEEEIRAGSERRLAYDREALLDDQILWLRQAGFANVDCVYRNFKMGLFFGAKGPLKW